MPSHRSSSRPEQILGQALREIGLSSTSHNNFANNLPSLSINQPRAAQVEHLALFNRRSQAPIQSSSGGSSVESTITGLLGSILNGSFGLGSLIEGLTGLFGGGSRSQPAPPVPFALPPSVHLQSGLSSNGAIAPADFDQNGQPRPASQSGTPPATQVTIQVQAMDSKSFLDHSTDIANAVRDAMLNSHSLNDVVMDL